MRLTADGAREQMPRLIEMGRAFHGSVAPRWPFDEAAFTATLEWVAGNGFLAATNRGFIAGVIAPNPLCPEWLIAKEFLWWAEAGGLRLARMFREWAAEQGAAEIQWSCPEGRSSNLIGKWATATERVYSEFV